MNLKTRIEGVNRRSFPTDIRDCYLCGDLQRDPKLSGISLLYDEDLLGRSVLWEDRDFFVTPAPGTITPGYLIVATKVHVARFADLPKSTCSRLAFLVTTVLRMGKRLGLNDYVFFEHGGRSRGGRGPACVDHAHMHLAPSPDPEELRRHLAESFEELPLRRFEEITGWNQGQPYIIFGAQAFQVIYNAEEAQSQFIRKLLAAQCGVPDQWNWLLHTFRDHFEITLDLFSGLSAEL